MDADMRVCRIGLVALVALGCLADDNRPVGGGPGGSGNNGDNDGGADGVSDGGDGSDGAPGATVEVQVCQLDHVLLEPGGPSCTAVAGVDVLVDGLFVGSTSGSGLITVELKNSAAAIEVFDPKVILAGSRLLWAEGDETSVVIPMFEHLYLDNLASSNGVFLKKDQRFGFVWTGVIGAVASTAPQALYDPFYDAGDTFVLSDIPPTGTAGVVVIFGLLDLTTTVSITPNVAGAFEPTSVELSAPADGIAVGYAQIDVSK